MFVGMNILITMSGLETLMAPNPLEFDDPGSFGFHLLHIRGAVFKMIIKDACLAAG